MSNKPANDGASAASAQPPTCVTWHQSLSAEKRIQVRLSCAASPARRSCARGPHVHLFGYLVHVTDVRPLIWVGVYAHADQLPQLQDTTTGTVSETAAVLLHKAGNASPSSGGHARRGQNPGMCNLFHQIFTKDLNLPQPQNILHPEGRPSLCSQGWGEHGAEGGTSATSRTQMKEGNLRSLPRCD